MTYRCTKNHPIQNNFEKGGGNCRRKQSYMTEINNGVLLYIYRIDRHYFVFPCTTTLPFIYRRYKGVVAKKKLQKGKSKRKKKYRKEKIERESKLERVGKNIISFNAILVCWISKFVYLC